MDELTTLWNDTYTASLDSHEENELYTPEALNHTANDLQEYYLDTIKFRK